MNEAAIEAQIQEKGLDAPRITPGFVDAQIADKAFFLFPGTTVTVCCLTLKNGFNTVGKSACASPENFDEQIGRDVAYADARDKIWKLEGYRLKQSLYEAERAEDAKNAQLVAGA